MGTTPTLEATQRDRIGTRYARRLRAAGKLPAVIYGHKEDPVAVALERRDVVTHLHHGQRVFNVAVNGAAQTCLVKDLQFDHLGTEVIHLDLTRIDMTEEVTVHVSLKFTGQPVGLKNTPGAIFRTVRDSLTVTCLASDIPSEAVVVDVSGVDLDRHLTAGDIALPPGVRLDDDPEEVIAAIDIVAEEEEAPTEEAPAEPEVITEKKEEAEEGEE